jgi:hypothetical protein
MLAFIYIFSICVVGAILFVAVDDLEPNRRYASVLKLLIVFVSAVAIARRLMP